MRGQSGGLGSYTIVVAVEIFLSVIYENLLFISVSRGSVKIFFVFCFLKTHKRFQFLEKHLNKNLKFFN